MSGNGWVLCQSKEGWLIKPWIALLTVSFGCANSGHPLLKSLLSLTTLKQHGRIRKSLRKSWALHQSKPFIHLYATWVSPGGKPLMGCVLFCRLVISYYWWIRSYYLVIRLLVFSALWTVKNEGEWICCPYQLLIALDCNWPISWFYSRSVGNLHGMNTCRITVRILETVTHLEVVLEADQCPRQGVKVIESIIWMIWWLEKKNIITFGSEMNVSHKWDLPVVVSIQNIWQAVL